MRLGEFPEGVYRVEQRLTTDCEVRTTLVPLRKRWWWFGAFLTDGKRLELLQQMLQVAKKRET